MGRDLLPSDPSAQVASACQKWRSLTGGSLHPTPAAIGWKSEPSVPPGGCPPAVLVSAAAPATKGKYLLLLQVGECAATAEHQSNQRLILETLVKIELFR